MRCNAGSNFLDLQNFSSLHFGFNVTAALHQVHDNLKSSFQNYSGNMLTVKSDRPMLSWFYFYFSLYAACTVMIAK
jgi:hypothetical protein